MQKQVGFTLMEILVTLGVFVTVSLISLPFIRQYQPNLKLDGVSRDLASDLRLAQQYSIAEQVNFYIDISTTSKTYSLFRTGSSSPIKNYYLPAEISYYSVTGFTNNRITFNSYGASVQSGTIIIKNSQKNRTINVKPSGYVELK